MGAESSIQAVETERFFTRCLLIVFPFYRCSFSFLNVKFFGPICFKFAVELDSNSKISQNVFFSEKIGFTKENFEFFSKSLKMAKLLNNAYHMVSFPINVFSALLLMFFF